MAAGRREGGFPIELVQMSDQVFVSTGQVREKGKKDGVEWIRPDLEELDDEAGLDLQRANQFSEVNPDAMLRFLRTTGDARKTGTAEIRGERTERYEGTIDLERYPELVPEEDKAAARRTVDIMVKSWGGTRHPISVFINDAGVIVREKTTISPPSPPAAAGGWRSAGRRCPRWRSRRGRPRRSPRSAYPPRSSP
jgi:hypothetical protein